MAVSGFWPFGVLDEIGVVDPPRPAMYWLGPFFVSEGRILLKLVVLAISIPEQEVRSRLPAKRRHGAKCLGCRCIGPPFNHISRAWSGTLGMWSIFNPLLFRLVGHLPSGQAGPQRNLDRKRNLDRSVAIKEQRVLAKPPPIRFWSTLTHPPRSAGGE